MTALSRSTKSIFCIVFIVVFMSGTNSYAATTYFEQPGEYRATDVLKPEMVNGRFHKVDDRVAYDGFLYHFKVWSEFGTFKITSKTSLTILIHELEAIAAMRKVEFSDTAVKSLQKSGKNTVSGIQNLFNDPEKTIRGAGRGISSLFSRATETIGHRELTETEDNRLKQLVGVTKSKGEVATRYGVSIYSRNKTLQEELERLAMADYLGGISIGLATSAVPGIGGLVLSTSGTARLLNETINITSAAELWTQNKSKLLAMGIDADSIELFLNNPVFTPALQTIVVSALVKMEHTANRELFIKVGLQASTAEMAKAVSEIAIMAAGYHKRIAPLKTFSTMARLLKAEKEDGSIVVFLPIDHMIWNQRLASFAAEIMEQGMDNDGAGFEIWTLGTFSDQARSSLRTLGWQLHEQALDVLRQKQ